MNGAGSGGDLLGLLARDAGAELRVVLRFGSDGCGDLIDDVG